MVTVGRNPLLTIGPMYAAYRDAGITCRYCLRAIRRAGMFWANDRGEIYCPASLGQHDPAPAEDS